MCRTNLYQSYSCRHCWLELVKRCEPDRDLSTCCQYQDNAVNWVNRLPPHRRKLVDRPCPECVFGRQYPRHAFLMVRAIRNGVSFGSGPSRLDSGYDCFCAVM